MTLDLADLLANGTRHYDDLAAATETHAPSFEPVYGTDPFGYLAQHPEEGAVFKSACCARGSVNCRIQPNCFRATTTGSRLRLSQNRSSRRAIRSHDLQRQAH